MVYMPPSPRGRTIEHVEGTPAEITSRGTAIETLGEQMLESADVLEDIATRAIEDGTQKGKAIEKLRESVGESYTVLREAGELYEPVGPVIRTYGEELAAVQPGLNGHADTCVELWTTFQSLPGSVEPRGVGGLFQPEEDSPEADAQGEEDEAKKAAYDAWETEAELFDADYDTWETAYDDAVENIGEEMAGSIKDGFWEFLDDLGEVLGWVAFAVGIVALVIGGPILAAIALGLAIAYFAVVAIQVAGGKKGWGDLGMAALGIIPLGKLAKISSLTKLAHFNKAGMKAWAKGPLSGFKGLKGLTGKPQWGGMVGTWQKKGPAAAFTELLTGSTSFRSVHRTHKQFYQGAGSALANIRNGNAVRNLALIDFGASALGTVSGHYGSLDKISGTLGFDLPDLPSIPGI